MQRRPFGNTGLSTTRLGLGLAALGRPGYITLDHAADLQGDYAIAALEANTHAVLDAAWDAGIRYFDAARSYGCAEEFLASWLRARPEAVVEEDLPIVGSKWGYTYTAGWQVNAAQHEVKEHTLPVLLRQFATSQTQLAPWLGLYQIHSATFDSGVLRRGEVLRELWRIKQTGMAIGLSLSGPDQAAVLDAALAVQVDGQPLFNAVQATWNLLEPSIGPHLAAAHQAGWGVIVKEAVANGRLTARNRTPDFAAKLAQLAALAAHHQTTVDAIALAAVLAQPWADVVLSGAATVAHLRANVAADHIRLTSDELGALQDLAETPQTYWATRSRLAWN
jgi:aryl-alcohol dehydrogenase-like predicted oxidoreductase